jgi:hypothetical protein
MKIGILKSRVEKLLSESYSKGIFKEEIKNFNRNVLSNKNISKLFYLYDELSTNKGYEQKLAEDFVFESITMFENIINKTEKKDLDKLKKWVIGVNSNNQYLDIDNLFYNSNDVLHLENKVRSKKVIVETLKKNTNDSIKETINLPLSTMVKIANKTIDDFISNLNESEKKELNTLLSQDETMLRENYQKLKDEAIVKLIVVSESESEEKVKTAINETIDNIKTKKFDRLEYFKLKNLVDHL